MEISAAAQANSASSRALMESGETASAERIPVERSRRYNGNPAPTTR